MHDHAIMAKYFPGCEGVYIDLGRCAQNWRNITDMKLVRFSKPLWHIQNALNNLYPTTSSSSNTDSASPRRHLLKTLRRMNRSMERVEKLPHKSKMTFKEVLILQFFLLWSSTKALLSWQAVISARGQAAEVHVVAAWVPEIFGPGRQWLKWRVFRPGRDIVAKVASF